MSVDLGSAAGYLLTLIGGGGIVELFRQIAASRTRRDDAKRADVNLDLAVDKQRSEEEQRFIDNLVKDNTTLRSERDHYRAQVQVMETELIEVRKRVDQLQSQIHDLLRSTQALSEE